MKIKELKGIDEETQHLIFENQIMLDEKKLENYYIKEDSLLILTTLKVN